MPTWSGDHRQCTHEFVRITLLQICARELLRRGDQCAEAAIGLWRMRHQDQLVRRMELHERSGAPSAAKQDLQAAVRKDPLDEVLAQARIGEATFFLNR